MTSEDTKNGSSSTSSVGAWEDQWNPETRDDEETLVIPSFDDLQVTYSGDHASLSGPAEVWGRLKRAADDIHRELPD